MGIEIKRVGRHDTMLFERVAEEVFDEPINSGRLAAYLEQPGHHMIVALHDGTIVGQAAAVIHCHPDKPTELYIDEVGVSPIFHRKGIARQMLEEMFALGRELGCEEAWVGTEMDNIPGRRLYETHGETKAEPFVMYVYAL